MTIPDLDTLTLTSGAHGSRKDGVCWAEAAAWLAGQPHTDHPPCVSPLLAAYGRSLNDMLPDDTRQQLKQYIRPALNTAGDGKDLTRTWLALDWLIRTWLPAWLNLAGLNSQATALQHLDPVYSPAAAAAAGPALSRARQDSAAARDAAGAAAWAAAGAAAGAAARAAAWAAARAALAPTVTMLQASAVSLFGTLITAGISDADH
jgi:hypothetical protein